MSEDQFASRDFTEAQQTSLLAALNQTGPKKPCPACGGVLQKMLERFVYLPVGVTRVDGDLVCVAVTCDHCAHVSLYEAPALLRIEAQTRAKAEGTLGGT